MPSTIRVPVEADAGGLEVMMHVGSILRGEGAFLPATSLNEGAAEESGGSVLYTPATPPRPASTSREVSTLTPDNLM